jgi:periplasmic protein TonB
MKPLEPDDDDGLKKYVTPAALILGLAALGGGGWWLFADTSSIERKVAAPPTLQMVQPDKPPPPPPPPPPPEQIPEVEPEQSVPDPTPTPQKAMDDAPKAMTMAADSQSGGDSFGLAAGDGKGYGAPSSKGTGEGPVGNVSDKFYKDNLRNALQEAVQSDDRVNKRIFEAVVKIDVDATGRVTRAVLVRSNSGDKKIDNQLIAILESIRGIPTPPPSFKFPQNITVRGRQTG